MGACFGGFIGSLLGGVWAPPAAAFGATLGGKAAELAFPDGRKVGVNGSALGMIVGTSFLGAVGIIYRPDVAGELTCFGSACGGLIGGVLSGQLNKDTIYRWTPGIISNFARYYWTSTNEAARQ